jgi:AraC-like DNA-binding protein
MHSLQTGHFFGHAWKTIKFNNSTLTESEYITGRIDWHCHRHSYFTFILSGEVLDATKTKEYYCSAGSLIFHQAQEPHYNIMRKGRVRSLHLEPAPGSAICSLATNSIDNPGIKILFHLIYKELRRHDDVSVIEIESLLTNIEDKLSSKRKPVQIKQPHWVGKVKDIICSQFSEKITLDYLAAESGVHPVHLCRDFSKYFHCSLGHYIRKTKIERALVMLANKNISLTEIAFDCGFADQSHFLRCFKQITGTKPSAYRKIILR